MQALSSLRTTLLSPRMLKLLGIAFAVGLLLFLLLWLDQRNDTEFFKADGRARTATGDVEGLPAPLPADVAIDGGNASGLRLPTPSASGGSPDEDTPRIIEPPQPAPLPPSAPTTPVPQVASGANNAVPVPLDRPAPRYPREALRQGAGGTVRVKVTVAPNGRVERMDVAESSGNRFLDRAALEAVRRWTFRPATRNGQPVTAEVIVPLEFNPNG